MLCSLQRLLGASCFHILAPHLHPKLQKDNFHRLLFLDFQRTLCPLTVGLRYPGNHPQLLATDRMASWCGAKVSHVLPEPFHVVASEQKVVLLSQDMTR